MTMQYQLYKVIGVRHTISEPKSRAAPPGMFAGPRTTTEVVYEALHYLHEMERVISKAFKAGSNEVLIRREAI